MSIDSIEASELTASERQVLADDRARWKRMGGGAHLDDWLAYAPGLQIRRRLAMLLAFTNRPEGKGYSAAFGQLMRRHDGLDWDDKSVKNSMGAVLWLNDDAQRLTVLREIRGTMKPGERARLNSPISARQRVEKVIAARASGSEDTLRTSPLTNLKRDKAELERELAETQAKLARALDGSLFDLKHDSADDIVKAVVANVTEHKAKAIATGILAAFKAKRTPAG